MVHRHAVDVPGKLESQIRHVQRALGATVRDFQDLSSLGAKHLPHQIPRKLVMPRWHRCVCCEDALRANRFDVFRGRGPEVGLAQPFLQ